MKNSVSLTDLKTNSPSADLWNPDPDFPPVVSHT